MAKISIDIEDIRAFEKELYSYMNTYHAEVGKAIAETGKLEAETEERLKAGISECKERFIRLG